MGDGNFTCEICIEPTLFTQKFSHDDCVHNICFMCIASHIQAKIDENTTTIKCPELECGKTLNPMECQPMIPPALFVKWCDCLCISSISTFKSSYCPNPNCSELILNECDEKADKCRCLGCKRLFCYTCRVPWHDGFWCSESREERDANDIEFGILVESMQWTRCIGCGQPTELIEGCNNVTCRCGRMFCHKCGLACHPGDCGERECCNISNIFCLLLMICLLVSFAFLMIWISNCEYCYPEEDRGGYHHHIKLKNISYFLFRSFF